MKNIPTFKNYSINENGDVWIDRLNRKKGTFLLRNGYAAVSLTKDGKQKNYTIHSLVLLTFVGERPSNKHEVMHLDGTRCNNSLSNLKWGTRSENCLDKKNHGTFQEGEKHGMHKLNKDQVLQIKSSNLPLVYFAKLFSVTPEAIGYAKNIGWKSLDVKPQ